MDCCYYSLFINLIFVYLTAGNGCGVAKDFVNGRCRYSSTHGLINNLWSDL